MTIVKIQTKNAMTVTSKRHREMNCVLFEWQNQAGWSGRTHNMFNVRQVEKYILIIQVLDKRTEDNKNHSDDSSRFSTSQRLLDLLESNGSHQFFFRFHKVNRWNYLNQLLFGWWLHFCQTKCQKVFSMILFMMVILILINFKLIEQITVSFRGSIWISSWNYPNLNEWRLKWQSHLPRLNFVSDWQSYQLLVIEWKMHNYVFIIWCQLSDTFNNTQYNNNKTFTFIDRRGREWADYDVVLVGYSELT